MGYGAAETTDEEENYIHACPLPKLDSVTCQNAGLDSPLSGAPADFSASDQDQQSSYLKKKKIKGTVHAKI